mmetsp:Transcript_11364/g.22211  ORF Transcript_11364/g.22211 Transcript_11364/m.22211 type:complete len:352 (+) Transcript_11364:152-1207(+)|eukprot:CAMPEP_0171494564 /NCGR_PEP_ID=MMETSP0958-20121227/5629_1 /TAXON_ID=87120 /ORGANISM="Aurantiochytrium limacinum, Strain ATCCMYA-1381" /LENGTH=351 /DNA_ID=CAMNT_0012028395 /DNA_START=101 /DNA_END=1156 /DNA_ORIENTATION=+
MLSAASRTCLLMGSSTLASSNSGFRLALRRSKVTAAMVKELRERTSSPMMQCKKALSDPEVDGDMEKAIEWLRKQGVAQAAKKSGRATNDGLVGVASSDDRRRAVLVEVTSETDFVARNDLFQKLVFDVASIALESGAADAKALAETEMSGAPVSAALTQAAATLGENIALKSSHQLAVANGVIGIYLHNKMSETACKQGAAVAIEADASLDSLDASARESLQTLADKLALQLVAAQALFLEDVPKEYIAKERELEKERLRNEALERAGDKEVDEDVLEKRVSKKVEKIIKGLKDEQVLLNQKSFVPEHQGAKISALLTKASKENKVNLTIKSAARFQVGAEEVILTPAAN